MPLQNDDLKRAIIALVDRSETLSKQVLALINLNAVLLRETCLSKNEPFDHFARLEAEIGGLGEAIAIGTKEYSDVVVSSHDITAVFEQVLRQSRDLLDSVSDTHGNDLASRR